MINETAVAGVTASSVHRLVFYVLLNLKSIPVSENAFSYRNSCSNVKKQEQMKSVAVSECFGNSKLPVG
jgi:hypothetical protein